MKDRQFKLCDKLVATLLSICFVTSVEAQEIIIQQEKLTFEKCLEVILASKSKLSVTPTITEKAGQNRVAVFKLSDGTLKIICDSQQDLVTVSTKTN